MTTDHIDRAAEIIAQSTPVDVPGYRMRYAVEAARALDDAGMLVTPEHDAAVAAEWADHFEVCQGMVGTERLTVESMIASLRGPRPFGRMAGESDADA